MELFGQQVTWDYATKHLSGFLTGGISNITPYIEQQTGWDTNTNASPIFSQGVVPVANIVGNVFGIGPAGDYLSGYSQALGGNVPLPINWVGNQPSNILDIVQQGTPAAPKVSAAAVAPTATQTQIITAKTALTRAGYLTGTWPTYHRYGHA